LLPGETYAVSFNLDSHLEMSVSGQKDSAGMVTVRATLAGSGRHTIALRSDNLAMEPAAREVNLKAGVPQTIEWQARPAPGAPWIAVVIPDRDMSRRKELTGR